MATSPCRKCGIALTADIQYCPRCGTPTTYSNLLLYDPTDSSTAPRASQQNPYDPSDSYRGPFQALPPAPTPARTRLIIGILIGIIVLLILSGIIGAIALTRGPGATQANISATATAQAQFNAVATARAQLNATATAQVQAITTPTAQFNINATATAVAALAIPCKYMYWQTGINTDKPLTNFGVPQGCVLVLDSFQGSLNGVNWNNGGVMAFPPGVYNGDIYNGEYEIVPEKANPNPKQVFCNRVQEVVTNHYAFSQAQPLTAWGLSGPQIVAQGRC